MAVQRSSSSADLRSFDTIDPRVEEVQDARVFTIRIHLPGFKKENLKVQLSSSGLLKVRGERPPQPGGSNNRWTRFQKEFSVPQDCNLDEIRAKFADGVLQVTISKLQPREPGPEPESALPPQQQSTPSAEQDAPQQQKPSSPPRPQEPAPPKEPQPPLSQVPAAEGSEDKDISKARKESEPAPEPAPGSSKDTDSSLTVVASGLRRRLSFVPSVGYGGGLSTKARSTGFNTAIALLLLLAGLWFAYVNYWTPKGSSAGPATLAPYPHQYNYGNRL